MTMKQGGNSELSINSNIRSIMGEIMMLNSENVFFKGIEKQRLPHDIPVADQSSVASPNKIMQDSGRGSTVQDLLQVYLHEIKQHKLLTREEEVALATKAREKNDEKATYKLIVSNLRLVVKIAMDFHRYWTKNLLDLIQEGNVGLLHAARKYDPHKRTKFSYYASFWIKAYMLKFTIDNWKLVKIGTTQTQRKLFFNLARERDNLLAQGFNPNPKLMAERLSVKEEEIVEMSQRLGAMETSLSTPLDSEKGESYEAFLRAPDLNIDEQLSEKENRKLLSKKLRKFRETLCGREIDIFDNRILAEKPETLQVLGDKHHISRERIRQIQKNIVNDIETWLIKEIPNVKEEYSYLLN